MTTDGINERTLRAAFLIIDWSRRDAESLIVEFFGEAEVGAYAKFHAQ